MFNDNHTCYQKTWCSTKRPEVLKCYDFYFGTFDEEEDVIFAIKLDMFLVRTIAVPIHIELVPKLVYILEFSITKSILKQPLEPVCVLAIYHPSHTT